MSDSLRQFHEATLLNRGWVQLNLAEGDQWKRSQYYFEQSNKVMVVMMMRMRMRMMMSDSHHRHQYSLGRLGAAEPGRGRPVEAVPILPRAVQQGDHHRHHHHHRQQHQLSSSIIIIIATVIIITIIATTILLLLPILTTPSRRRRVARTSVRSWVRASSTSTRGIPRPWRRRGPPSPGSSSDSPTPAPPP
jgi:hypothetical protein